MIRPKVIALLAALLFFTPLVAQQRIEVRGSDAMIMLGQRWSQRLSAIYPAARLEVAGGGSTEGITMLGYRRADVLQLPRPLSVRERETVETATGHPVLQFPVAVESALVYVNEGNPVQELTMAQLRDIYLGKVDNWKALGGRDQRIQLYSTESFVGGSLFFRETVLNGQEFDTTMRGYSNSRQMIDAVAADRGGIGFGGPMAQPQTRRLRIKRSADSPAVDSNNSENLRSGKYPLSRYLYWTVRQPMNSNLREVCGWVISSEGQLLVESLGYFPLNSEDRNKGAGSIAGAK